MAETGFNLYLDLELDLAVQDPAQVLARLEACIPEWTRRKLGTSGDAQKEANRKLANVDKMRAACASPDVVRQHAEDARAKRSAQKEEAHRNLIYELEAHGELRPERRRLFVPPLTEAELEQAVAAVLRPLPLRPLAVKPLEAALFQRIHNDLAVLGKRDLYDFLDCPRQTSSATLIKETERVQKAAAGRTDVPNSARARLCGHCKTLFADEKQRKGYDYALALAPIRRLLEPFASARTLRHHEFARVLQEAESKGVDHATARELLEDELHRREWRLFGRPEELTRPRLCGVCLALAAAAARTCSSCGSPLELACRKCGKMVLTRDRVCPHCGEHTGDAALLAKYLAEAEKHKRAPDVPAALASLANALLVAPDWKPALELRAQLEKRAREAQEQEAARVRREERRRAARRAVEQEVEAGRLVAARTALEELMNDGPSPGDRPSRELLSAKVDDGIRIADRAVQEGRRLRRNPKEAIQKFWEALQACADHPEAAAALRELPPPKPTGVKLALKGDTIVARWEAVVDPCPLTYVVSRSASASLGSDGTKTECRRGLTVTSFCDEHPEGGCVNRYWVRAVRGEGLGESEETGSEPAFWPSEASDVTYERSHRVIQLSWVVPASAKRCLVTRLEGGVPVESEGDPLSCERQGARDSNVDDGKTYGYRIRTVYSDPHLPHGEILTPGAVKLVEPANGGIKVRRWRDLVPVTLRDPRVFVPLALVLALVCTFILLAVEG